MCLFAIIYVPGFSWWLPNLLSSVDEDSSPSSGKAGSAAAFLQKINNVLLPLCIGIALVEHIYYTLSAFWYVDGRPIDPAVKSPRNLNTRRHWLLRLLLLGAVLTSVGLGRGILNILEDFDLARVKPKEYLIIVLPIQINLGIQLGSLIQHRVEQRQAARRAVRGFLDAEAAQNEKQHLLD